MHLVCRPLTTVLSSICPQLRALPFHSVFIPLTVVGRSVRLSVLASAFLVAHVVLAYIRRTSSPPFFATAMLLVVPPVAFVSSACLIRVDSEPVGFVVRPTAFIHVSLRVNEFALSPCLVILPLSNVGRADRPLHCALAVPHSALPLTLVDSTCLVFVRSLFERRVRSVNVACECLSCLLWLEVLA